MKFPWLQSALVRAEANLFVGDDPLTTTFTKITSDTGALEPYTARRIVGDFISSLQRPAPGGFATVERGDKLRVDAAERPGGTGNVGDVVTPRSPVARQRV